MAAEIVVRIPRNSLKFLLMALAILVSAKETQSTESVQLTTYYPAPSGVYQQILTTSNAYLATTGGGSAVVGNTSNPTGSKLYVWGDANGAKITDRSGCFQRGNGGPCVAFGANRNGVWYPHAVYAP